MMAALASPEPMTVAEFVTWNGPGPYIYQLVDGYPYAMAPGSVGHAAIQSQVTRLLGNHLAPSRPGCAVYANPGVVPKVNADMNYRVPDLAVSCEATTPGQAWLREPVLLIEILSPSNEKETWTNVWSYTTIPSVREILVVRSTVVGVMLLRRQANGEWPDRPDTQEDGVLELQSIGFSHALEEFYVNSGLTA